MLLLTKTFFFLNISAQQHPDSANPLLSLHLNLIKRNTNQKQVYGRGREEKEIMFWVVMLPGDTFVFNVPVDAWAVGSRGSIYNSQPYRRKYPGAARHLSDSALRNLLPSLVHTVYLYSYTPFCNAS